MFKILLLTLTLQFTLFAYSDFDLDGVEDIYDRCPNTPFNELVDANGCTISYLTSTHNFDIIYGISFTKLGYSNDNTSTTTQNLQLDYYYKKFSLELSTSYFSSKSNSFNENGTDDSFIGAYYQLIPFNNLKIKTGVGIILPTYDSELNNNNTDYTANISLSYTLDKINLFVGYNFTKINDDDLNTTITADYQDTNSYSFGAGFYPTPKLYLSASYFSSDSIYANVDTIDTLSAYIFYSLNSNWFTTLNYAYGLSDSASDSYTSFRIGYSF